MFQSGIQVGKPRKKMNGERRTIKTQGSRKRTQVRMFQSSIQVVKPKTNNILSMKDGLDLRTQKEDTGENGPKPHSSGKAKIKLQIEYEGGSRLKTQNYNTGENGPKQQPSGGAKNSIKDNLDLRTQK